MSSAPPEAPSSIVRGRVLLVEDDEMLSEMYARFLEASGAQVVCALDGNQALDFLGREQFDAVLSDIGMPGLDGLELLRITRERNPDLPVVLITGNANLRTALRALEHGAMRYLVKPIDGDALVAAARTAVERHRAAQSRQRALQLYEDSTRADEGRAELEGRFNQALEKLHMAYQPIVSPGKRSTFAYEALVRTEEPSLRRPDLLITAAEGLGRLFELGQAIRASVAGCINGCETPPTIFMNLHPRDLADETLYSKTAPLSLVAKHVILEITERASLDAIDDLQARLASLRELGFRVAIDDLGAGYAGLTSFAQLRPDVVKLDMSLTRDVDRDPTKQKIIESITKLCADFRMLVVVEGVETAAERDTLLEIGCDLMQGYFFAKPASPFPTVIWEEVLCS